ncbi:MAG TPA: hypothetical protein VD736_07660 [Nitrososphaera sp.]|nr:hypothetical protein [Nitrososphaera sp.]
MFEPGLKHFLFIALIAVLPAAGAQAFADPLANAYRQRIGNYDLEMTTKPASPVAGSMTDILVRIAGVNGDDLVDTQITMRLARDGEELQRTNPIIVPYGQYTHEYTFSEPGRHVLYVDLNDYSYSGEILTFTFFVNVAGPLDYLYFVAPSAAVAAAAIAWAIIFMRKRQASRLNP